MNHRNCLKHVERNYFLDIRNILKIDNLPAHDYSHVLVSFHLSSLSEIRILTNLDILSMLISNKTDSQNLICCIHHKVSSFFSSNNYPFCISFTNYTVDEYIRNMVRIVNFFFLYIILLFVNCFICNSYF